MKKVFGIILLTIFLLCSCQGEDGKSTPPKFEPALIVFENIKSSAIIKSVDDEPWWFNEFEVNNKLVPDSSLIFRYYEGKEHNSWNICAVEGEWFNVRKINNQTIEIQVTETSQRRTFSFIADRGNSYQKISIIQNEKK